MTLNTYDYDGKDDEDDGDGGDDEGEDKSYSKCLIP